MLTNKEKELISEIRKGNTRAFSDFVDSYKDLVFTLSVRMLGNREEAEEVAQDVFINVYKSLPSFKGDSKVSTWVYRIAYNSCLDRLKKIKRKRVHTDLDHIEQVAHSEMDTALDKMVRQERSEIIGQCLSQLSAEDAGILTLFYFEEKNLQEIGQTTNLSVNTLKVRLFRARKKLAGIMEKNMNKEILESNG
ncbi:RNA polymerase sigma factor [Flagellimonas halotolerans]|uniref:Sigma-70 family RNA polymerase sigma factor n=1 Tax=Flagellimonas halotolerans TaxID=3112164 RepID=A0ABU6IS69_9FLAO|nr:MULTISPECIES: sigma-70 family RNA polymerase sigma factor [unclassified Allomuricauda]MEC3966036.1 sigma-70 family RNA polymerase sigma factor [Muricauda sp. SYSU M86414]MEC4265854.1 sigma-70 family RNA polymerase sigma factor [Muricauda sp. SYSU M84420]